ncbi:nucleoporin-62 C-terminal-like protein [Myotis myotis]|nr:nucleoporin-62 C-terminal-like protein [Myotis myotis]
MTYHQLDNLINKWNLELEDQEKHSLYQTTQVNSWDHTLIENGEKITVSHGEVEKVKLDRKRLENESDFLLSQQKEIEDPWIPLEESLKDQSSSVYQKYEDEEHERIYKLTENIDVQLKQMAQDLKNIIEHLNIFEKPADTIDLLKQISRILNAHMDSLERISQNPGMLQRKVEEVAQVFQNRLHKEQEHNVRMAFN